MARNQENTNNVPENGVVDNTTTPATSTVLNDDTKVLVKSLVPAVYYSCSVTYESFAWVEVGDTQEMTYKQLRIMNQKYPRYFTEKWLLPCNEDVINKLKLAEIYRSKLNRGDKARFYGDDVKAVEELLSSLNDKAKSGLTQEIEKSVKNGKIANVKIIRLCEKYLGIELMQYV